MLTAQIGRVLSTQGMGSAESLTPYPRCQRALPKFTQAVVDEKNKKGWGHEPRPNGRRREEG